MDSELKITRVLAGETVPVQIGGNNSYDMIKLDEPGYQIRFSTQYLVVTDSQLKEARDEMERLKQEKLEWLKAKEIKIKAEIDLLK